MPSTAGLRRFAKRIVRTVTRPWITQRRIVADLRALGLRGSELLLVHPALPPLGHVLGGPRTVISALRQVVGDQGTLVLPAHTWESANLGERTFDVRMTPSSSGAIAEEFRKTPGVVRSLHPTHSVTALGPLSRQLVSGHHLCRYPCGPGSPYVRALDLGCHILLLGVGLESNTSHHAVEALAEVPYLLNDTPDRFILIDETGATHESATFRHRRGVRATVQPIAKLLEGQLFVRLGQVGCASAILMDGRSFRDLLLAALQANPALLLC
jgi:aminoglycoside 3-N-acetyltransferase